MKEQTLNSKQPRLLPGFGLTLGVTLTILSIIIILPVGTILGYAVQIPPTVFGKLLLSLWYGMHLLRV